MGLHRAKLGRRGMVALAATGALIVGGGAAAAVGTGSAEPLVPLTATALDRTYVLPDLAPFKRYEVLGAGTYEVTDAFGAPTGGGEAALRLTTPADGDKASIATDEDGGTPLEDWIPTAAYSAYQDAADRPFQFPSMQLVVDYNGDAPGGFSTLTYEPVYNAGDSTAPNEWHRYQAGTGLWCSTQPIPDIIDTTNYRCGTQLPLSAYIAAQPDIVVTGLVINQGRGNPGLDAAVDLVSTPSTTYDFELVEPAVVPGTDECDETTVPELPELPEVPEGEHGGGQDNGGGDEHEGGGQENGGHQNGHQNGGHEGGQDNGGHEGGQNGGDEEPEPQPEPEPCS